MRNMTKPKGAEICCDEIGFEVRISGGGQPIRTAWSEVQSVLAYKRDLITTDLVCLGFVTTSGTVEVTEEMRGWSELVERLPGSLVGIRPFREWWERIAQPPFAASMTTLYKRTDDAHLP